MTIRFLDEKKSIVNGILRSNNFTVEDFFMFWNFSQSWGLRFFDSFSSQFRSFISVSYDILSFCPTFSAKILHKFISNSVFVLIPTQFFFVTNDQLMSQLFENFPTVNLWKGDKAIKCDFVQSWFLGVLGFDPASKWNSPVKVVIEIPTIKILLKMSIFQVRANRFFVPYLDQFVKLLYNLKAVF